MGIDNLLNLVYLFLGDWLELAEDAAYSRAAGRPECPGAAKPLRRLKRILAANLGAAELTDNKHRIGSQARAGAAQFVDPETVRSRVEENLVPPGIRLP